VGWGVENYGTDPDLEVDIAPHDFAAGRDPQLERAIAEIKRLLREKKTAVPKLDQRPDLRAPKLEAAARDRRSPARRRRQ
jgi:tricorn protease